jgi:C-terminal processing protease CtpA/Prc
MLELNTTLPHLAPPRVTLQPFFTPLHLQCSQNTVTTTGDSGMTRRILAAALVLAVVLPALATAQDRQRSRSRSADRVRPRVEVFNFNRARIGITVQTQAEAETDRYGAKVVSVVEDGPADEAGIKEGDIITEFNGTSLAEARQEDDDVSGPGLRLVELAHDLDEGDTVKVEYRRDGSTHSATLVAEAIGDNMSFYRFNEDGPEMMLPKFEGPRAFQFHGEPGDMRIFEGPGNFSFQMGGGHGLQMLEMNADLGEYFGTNEGLLVTQASRDSAIPFRVGDVILAIDGRKPTSVAHAFRIIRSYEEGETIRAEVMRKRQRVNLEWTVKESEGRVRSMLPSRRPMTRERQPSGERTRM